MKKCWACSFQSKRFKCFVRDCSGCNENSSKKFLGSSINLKTECCKKPKNGIFLIMHNFHQVYGTPPSASSCLKFLLAAYIKLEKENIFSFYSFMAFFLFVGNLKKLTVRIWYLYNNLYVYLEHMEQLINTDYRWYSFKYPLEKKFFFWTSEEQEMFDSC